MENFAIGSSVEKLESIFLELLYSKPEGTVIRPSIALLEDIRECLNRIFPENPCTEVIYTQNTDKLFFGLNVNPLMSSADTITIVTLEDRFKLGSYKLEFDSKLFECGLNGKELVAYILFEISELMDSYDVIDKLRVIIDANLALSDDFFDIRESANYCQLVTYAIKDSLRKLSSIMYKNVDETELEGETKVTEVLTNNLILSLEMNDDLVAAKSKIVASECGPGDSLRSADVVVLKWFFTMYRDMKHNSSTIMDTLRDAKAFTGSYYEKQEIDATIAAVDHIDATIMIEHVALDKVFEQTGLSKLNEGSLFKSLKQNGLRSIEDYLFELKLRIKNLETEEDAMFVMRALNTRLNILTDYIYNTDLSDSERRHWEVVAAEYRKTREELVKKKIWNRKQYGLFFDYDQLDTLDN